ncbi:MAG: transglutaminase domain-containing protein [Huintestinicola sp.]
MKILRFYYKTSLEFQTPIKEHVFSLKIVPQSDGRQAVLSNTITVAPPEDTVIWFSSDSFGNKIAAGRCGSPHSSFSFEITGEAAVSADCYSNGEDRPFYYSFSPMTEPSEKLRDFYLSNLPPSGTRFERAMSLCNSLYENFTYAKNSTGTSTTAAQAFEQGMGVCQDYAHIFLSLCRMDGISCRYAAGLACDEGETHAWTEIFDGGSWFGIDPTNNCLVSDKYIKLSQGRDFGDCAIERGLYLGGSSCKTEIVSRLESVN